MNLCVISSTLPPYLHLAMPVAAAADPSYPAGVKVQVTFESLYGAMLIASMANML